MVKKRFLLIALSVALVFAAFLSATAQAWTGTYHLEHEWVKIWINQNGSIDLLYDIQLTLDSGDTISKVFVGQPKRDFTIGPAVDEYGLELTASDVSSGSDYKVQVALSWGLAIGESVKFDLITNVASMLYNDTTNPGNIGMEFTPSWYEAPVNDLRIEIVLPPNVTAKDVHTTQTAYWNNTADEDGCVTVYWEKQDLASGEQYPIGISFPAEYLPDYTPPAKPIDEGAFDASVFVIAGVVVAAIVVAIVIIAVVFLILSKKPYTAPKLSMESLGIRRGLTAVEASYLLEMKPTHIVTEILYSLLKKRAVWIEAAKPVLKLKVMPDFEDKKGTPETPLRYYEIDFIDAIKNDGTLDEEKLAHTVMYLRDTVAQKLRGYSRTDTVNYYRKIVAKAWAQVEQAGTTELASNAYNEQLLWLLLDPNYRARTEATFQNRVFEPNPVWFWYWYGYHYYHPHPTYTPNIGASTQAAKPPAIPGADFANNIATAVEKTSSNIVLSLEKFANSIIPAPPPTKSSHAPARHDADCVCACHACACACACVSCACACAGGGVG
jgi:hypothetical protein